MNSAGGIRSQRSGREMAIRMRRSFEDMARALVGRTAGGGGVTGDLGIRGRRSARSSPTGGRWVFPMARSASTPDTQRMALLYSLGGLAFVSLLMALFVVIARFVARRVLDKDDGSSLM